MGNQPAGVTPSQDRGEAAAYVADLTADLAEIARNHGLETLSYLPEIARLEAETAAHQIGPL